MEYELLEFVSGALQAAGLPAGEAYPGLRQPEVDRPTAAVGLRELDTAAGVARFRVQVLSPRILGGWCCQVWAARAAQALTGAGMTCTTEEMEYVSGSDCFCTAVTASMAVVFGADGWIPGQRWMVCCAEEEQLGVESFTAQRDQQRRLVGSHWAQAPVTVTPGRGGWVLELIQNLDRDPEEMEEPFVLTVRDGTQVHRYTGCCWNEIHYDYTGRGLRLTRRGFALEREVVTDG